MTPVSFHPIRLGVVLVSAASAFLAGCSTPDDGAVDAVVSESPLVGQKYSLNPDFNHDGKTDLIWRNFDTGESAVWYMDGKALIKGDFFSARRGFHRLPAWDSAQ